MKQSVLDTWFSFSRQFEGDIAWPYLDVKNLVTIGIGNLIDPVSEALKLDFTIDGRPATEAEIRYGWQCVKAAKAFSKAGAKPFEKVSKLRLSKNAIESLVLSKLRSNEQYLAGRFKDWESLPASAQMGVLSMAWAMGPAFKFPKFEKALNARDYKTCAAECKIDETGNAGVVARNEANKKLFLFCLAGDPEVVSWP